MPTPGGRQRMSIVNESGLYKLILRAQRKKAGGGRFPGLGEP